MKTFSQDSRSPVRDMNLETHRIRSRNIKCFAVTLVGFLICVSCNALNIGIIVNDGLQIIQIEVGVTFPLKYKAVFRRR